MNADVQKLRDSRLFKKLPDRAFDRILQHIKVRSFERGETALQPSNSGEFAKYFGYIVTGRVIFLTAEKKPVGMVFQDEFFLGRSFSIEEHPVAKIVSAHDHTLIVFIPKSIIETLATASTTFSEMVEDIYETIYERAELIAHDVHGEEHFDQWLKSQNASKTLSTWVSDLEKKKIAEIEKKKKSKKQQRFATVLWVLGFFLVGLALWEAAARYLQNPMSPLAILTGTLGPYEKKAAFNIWMGIIGYILILLTNLHSIVKWGIKKHKWKINYKHSGQLHIFFGIVGALFVLIHTAGHIRGGNIAHFGLYFMLIVLLSGLIGQLISAKIPKTISGDKMKLNNILKEQEKLKKKAELLMDDQQFKTSVNLMAVPLPNSFWVNLFNAPILWLRSRKIKSALKSLGLGSDAASLAASLVAREFELRQKIRSLEVANIFFKRWMWIHIPMGYLVFISGGLHVLFVYLQGLLKNLL